MTHLTDDPKRFAADSLAGMVAANPGYLQPVHGGVVRSTASPEGEVSVVVGGGSGHYPAFAGWVGPGMAHGSVCGNIFASPSTSQVLSVARNADNGGGVLLLFGNYAGDCLHFGRAAAELEERGIRAVTVPISDDIASNTPDEHEDRRGIAGDLMVVKVAGAAAALGRTLDEVRAVARKANAATRSLGVAFSGCTLPGASEPLFTVPEGSYSLGLGIHGEPGLSLHPLNSASEIADLLVTRILEEQPPRDDAYAGRVAVLVNGLGATKYEELFLLYGRVARRLEDAGLVIVAPVVGEQVTSLDMAGASLTIMFLDEELEALWTAPADSPAFRTGVIDSVGESRVLVGEDTSATFSPSSRESAAQAVQLLAVLEKIEASLVEAEESLGKLDSIAGDGDHGQGMVLGITAAVRGAKAAIDAGAGAKSTINHAGDAWEEGAGGTSGGYWGEAFRVMARSLSDRAAVSEADLAAALASGVASFAAPGGAVVGDKTMVDATEPYRRSLEESLASDTPITQALHHAAEIATAAAESTSDLVAKRGRARTHGAVSVGYPDPGAVSFALVVRTIATAAHR